MTTNRKQTYIIFGLNRAPEPSQERDNPAGGKGGGGAISPQEIFLIWWLLKESKMNSRKMYEL